MPFAFGNPAALFALALLAPVLWLAAHSHRRLTDSRRRVTLAVRTFGLILLGLALADFRLQRPTDALATVFLLDESASVSADARRRAQEFVRDAVRNTQPEDRYAVAAFGRYPIVATGWQQDPELEPLRVDTDRDATNLAAALDVALAMFPERRVGRIIVLGDGVETHGEAAAMTGLVRWQGVSIDVVPLTGVAGADPAVLDVHVPQLVEPGARVPVRVELVSTSVEPVTVRVFRNGAFWQEEKLTLIKGTTTRVYEDIAGQEGATLYRVDIEAGRDARAENNTGLGLVRVATPPMIWIVDGDGAGRDWAALLDAGGLPAAVVAPGALPDAVAGYADVRTVVLNNVPASYFTRTQQEALAAAVREFGVGLVMTGSMDSFGPGGWRLTPVEEVLPVTMESTRPREGKVGIVIILDVSGSMNVVVEGRPRLRFAQDAAFNAYTVAEPDTLLGVVAFSARARVILPLERRTGSLDSVGPVLGSLRAAGGTHAAPAIREAIRMLTESEATTRHIIFMTDGILQDAPLVAELYPALRSSHITLSTVGAGPDVDEQQLRTMAKESGGIFYPFTRAAALPSFFAQDTLQVVRNPLVQGPLVPVPRRAGAPVRGVDWANAPLLDGMISTTARETAQTYVTSPDQDPLVASWRVGLATTAVLCTDLGTMHARRWRGWAGRDALLDSLVRATLPPLDPAAFSAELRMIGDEAVLTADAVDTNGEFINGLELEATLQPPDGRAQHVALRQVGPGQYAARVAGVGTGVFTAQVRDGSVHHAGRQWVSAVRPYPLEFVPGADGSALLAELAAATGGQTLTAPAQAFRRPPAPKTVRTDLWPWLTGLALCLFPVDIALRRFTGPVRTVAAVPAPTFTTQAVPARKRPRARKPVDAAVPAMAETGAAIPQSAAPPHRGEKRAPATRPEPPPAAPAKDVPAQPVSTTSRLLAAKKKAREDRDA